MNLKRQGTRRRFCKRPSLRISMNRRLPVVLILCLAAIAALPTFASARSTQFSVIQDDAKVIASGDQTRAATLDEMRGLGADVLKISISWRDLAGGGKPSNPDD